VIVGCEQRVGRERRVEYFFGNYILNFFLLFLLHCHLECLSVCGQYRPNRAPNPESAVGLTGPPYAVLVKAQKMPGV
jgi:hypothetical protein